MTKSRNFDYTTLRKSFGNSADLNEVPYLLSLQKDSYKQFLQSDVDHDVRENIGIQAVFNSFFPLSDASGKVVVEFLGYTLGEPKYSATECLSAGKSFSSSLKSKLRLVLWHKDDNSGEKEIRSIKEQEIYLCEIPLMTDSGSFIINGAERVIVSQVRRAPGVFFDGELSKTSNSKAYSAKIIPHIGSWLDFEYDTKDTLYFRVDKKRKIPASSLLKAIGMSTAEIIKFFYGSTEAEFTKNGLAVEFSGINLLGKKTSYDIVCAKTNEVKIKEGTKVTNKLLQKLAEDKGFKKYLLTEDALLGYVFADDIINNETGEVLFESGSVVTAESLDRLKELNFTAVAIVNPSKSDIGPYLYNTILIDKNHTYKDALFDIYKSVRSGEAPASLEVAKSYLDNLFFSDVRYNLSEVGRIKMNYRLGLDIDKSTIHLTAEDIKQTIKILNLTKHNDLKTDDIDNLANRRVRAVGELIENQLRVGMLRIEKSILEKLNAVDVDTVMPQSLINSKPLASFIKDFFATSQLSQFMDQTNPLAEVTHKRRLSALGPGGLTRERAGFEVRDVHHTHYGRICPIETPEGQNIGLINSLATFARVDSYGFIETPYRKVQNGVVTNEIKYLSAVEEIDYVTAPFDVEVDPKTNRIKEELVTCRKNGEFVMLSPDKVNFIDVSAKQTVSVATTLIPFLENDDANRALMGSNMQRQAVPLTNPDVPLVGTGMEKVIAADSGFAVKAAKAGVVKFVDAKSIVVESNADGSSLPDVQIYDLSRYKRTNQDTCIDQKPTVKAGDIVTESQIISNGGAIQNGEIALGKNVRVAFMPWNGYNFEDSVVISERLLTNEAFTSIHIEELEIVARDTRLGPEEITRDIPNVSDESLVKLDEEGIIVAGATVNPGDLLVGKTTPKSESPVTPEEKLLKVIFGEKASDVRDSSLYAPAGVSGTVIDVKVFTRKGIEKDERSIYIEMQQIEELTKKKNAKLEYLEDVLVTTLRSLFNGKTIANSVDKVKPKTKLNMTILSSLSQAKLSKVVVEDDKVMNNAEKICAQYSDRVSEIEKDYASAVEKIKTGEELGQGVLKVVKVYVASKYRLQSGDKMAGRHGNKGVVSKIVPIEDMPYSSDGEPVDVVLNPLGVPSRMNIGQILETHLGLASKELGKQISAILDDLKEGKSSVKDLKTKLLSIYSSATETARVSAMGEEELLEFANKLRNGVPFSTGIFDGATDTDITSLLEQAGSNPSGQIDLFDGRTGDKFDRKVTVGYIYMLKLHHLVDDKIHARSIGPYSLITQQPLGGKSHFGGQRFGEMECWALQAYGAAYTLQEMLTVKSDDVVGRIKIYESIVQGNQNFNCGIPESFNVMIKEVRSLGLNIELVEKEEK